MTFFKKLEIFKSIFSIDHRAAENPLLALFHVTFLRLHNIVAGELNKINPKWDSDKVFEVGILST